MLNRLVLNLCSKSKAKRKLNKCFVVKYLNDYLTMELMDI